jgi:hypothetical protein
MVQYLFLHSHFYSFITPLSATTKEKAKQEWETIKEKHTDYIIA